MQRHLYIDKAHTALNIFPTAPSLQLLDSLLQEIKLLLPGPKVGLLELLRRPVEQQQQRKGFPDLSGHSFSPLVPGGLDNQGVRGDE